MAMISCGRRPKRIRDERWSVASIDVLFFENNFTSQQAI
jgi:hypothetical protein